ncbi:MAG: dephospho-CoA kinase [Candidatus Omnitrophota bacterium]
MAKKVIGVTGGLATGKTTVVDMFVAKGAVKIDADVVSHRLLLEDEDIKRKVTKVFGDDIVVNGEIDRRKLAEKVFFDKEGLEYLDRILHPAIIGRIKEEIKRNKDKVVVLDAPLLVETDLQDIVDIVVVVFCDHETQIKRAADRGISEHEAKSIIAMQMPMTEKVKFADFTIDNSNEEMKAAKEGVDKIWQKT